MSSTKYQLTLSYAAREDFRDILSYTLQMWGDRQMEEYGSMLHAALIAIEQNPEIGKTNLPPYRYFKVAQHYIFYRLHKNNIAVSRILHGKMDFIRHLDN